MRQALKPGIALMLSLTTNVAQNPKDLLRNAEQCCRPATRQVSYTTGAPSDVDPYRIACIRTNGNEFNLSISGYDQKGTWSVWETSNSGKTWAKTDVKTICCNVNLASIAGWKAPSDPQILYRTSGPTGFERSSDGGTTWKQLKPLLNGRSEEDFASSIVKKRGYRVSFTLVAIDPHDPLTVYAGVMLLAPPREEANLDSKRLYQTFVSHDGGNTWTKFADDVLGWMPLGISPINPNFMYDTKIDPRTGKRIISKSVDGGRSWNPVGEHEALNEAIRPKGETPKQRKKRERNRTLYIDTIQWVFDPSDVNVVYLVSTKGVYRTENGGQSWCLLDFGLDGFSEVSSMAVNPLRPREIFIATYVGVFRSEDRGCHFESIIPPDSRPAQIH